MASLTRITAPAKLNLFLHITGKRGDGFHLLESLTMFTAFGDTLEIAPSDALVLHTAGPQAAALGPQEGNLVLRAAQKLRERAGIGTGAAMILHKHIPVGAGLGGGSADAAAALAALSHFWGLAQDKQAFQAIARELGSDVPACALGMPGWVTGVGEYVSPLQAPGGWVLLANPGTPLLTANVFRAYGGGFAPSMPKPEGFKDAAALAAWAARQKNDLEAPAIALLPVIADILQALRDTQNCLLARMSGSGATCFALYGSEKDAVAAAGILRAAHPAWWLMPTELKGSPHGKAQ